VKEFTDTISFILIIYSYLQTVKTVQRDYILKWSQFSLS